MEQATLSIIIPAYNEERTIAEVTRRVWETPLQENVTREIIIVDDGSKDATVKVVKEFLNQNNDKNIRLIECGKNRGKGAAIREGIKQASANDHYSRCRYGILSSRLQYLTSTCTRRYADVVYGSRFVGGNPHRIYFFGFYRK
jgi:glycosyltransferase involved in cell wall biosynthesis